MAYRRFASSRRLVASNRRKKVTFRTLIAAAISATVIISVFVLGMYVAHGRSNASPTVDGLGHAMFFFFFFGWPIAFVTVTAVAGIGSRLSNTPVRDIPPVGIVGAACALGAIGFASAWAAMWGDTTGSIEIAAMGAVAGLLAGVCFVLIVRA